jgi:amino acid adenylation domain-containing protein
MALDSTLTTQSLLPTNRPRGREAVGARVRHAWRLDAGLCERLEARAVTSGTELAEIVLAALVVLVARYSREETVTVDLTGRAISALGHLDAELPAYARERLSVDVDRETSLESLVKQIRPALRRVHGASESSGVLFDVGGPAVPAAAAEWCLTLESAEGGVALSIDAVAELFDVSTLERTSHAFTRLLADAARDPAMCLMRTNLLEPEERALLLDTWNSTAVPRTGQQVMHRLIEAQVAATPSAIAVEIAGRRVTYRELNDRANTLAIELVARGVGPDALVGLCIERSAELVVAVLAILKAGGAFVPIDPELPRDRVRFMLEETQATLVLVDAARSNWMYEIVGLLGTKVIVVAARDADAPVPRTANLADRCAPEHRAYLMFTSGSTGRPKGVLVPHRAVCNHALWFADRLDMTPADRMLQHASIGFDAAMAEIFAPLVVGATVVLAPPKVHRDLLALPELLRTERISVAQIVPSALRVVVDAPGFDACHTLRYLVIGGEALEGSLAAAVLANLPHVRLGNFYGPTEAAVDATSHEVTRVDADSPTVPIGKPIANVRCRILDPWLDLTPIGVPGELCLGGLGLANGYLNAPERSAAWFVDDPFAPGERLYRTGDLARYLPDGTIEFIGRVDTQVKLRGYRIELAEVESPLRQHPDVRQAAVVLREDTPGDPQLVAYVVLKAESTLTIHDLRALLRDQLPAYMVPSAYCLLDSLPLMSNAKLDRRALPAPSPMAFDAHARPPLEDPLERSLQEIWERSLRVQPIGPDDDFFALGGHSLKAIRLLADVERELGVALRAATLFEAPTIRRLAAWMRDDRARTVSTVIPVQPKGDRSPLFFAPGAGGELFVFDALGRSLGVDQPLYVLDMYVFDEIDRPDTPLTLGEVAARMLADIRRVQPQGPYQLAGYSLGGNIVLETDQGIRICSHS